MALAGIAASVAPQVNYQDGRANLKSEAIVFNNIRRANLETPDPFKPVYGFGYSGNSPKQYGQWLQSTGRQNWNKRLNKKRA